MKINRIFGSISMAILLFVVGNVHAQGIEFEHGTWEEVVAKAEKENKPIFVDAYTTWCGPCKWMAKNTFTQEEVGAYFKQNFIAYKMDMEKGEGPAFAKANNVQAYPTLLYFSAKGDLIHKGVGARDADGLLGLSNDALDPKKQFVGFVNKYEEGNRDKAFLYEYLNVLMACGENIQSAFKEYWGLLSDDEKQTKEGLGMLGAVTYRFSDLKDPHTQYFLENKAAYEKVASKEEMNMYLESCYINSLWKIARNEDGKEQKALSKELLAIFPDKKPEFSKRLAYVKASLETPPNEAKVAKAHEKYLKICQDGNELNSAAWAAYENTEDMKKLKQALGWVNRSIEISSGYANLDTKAALLFKMKEYEEAKIFAEKAIKAAMDAGYESEPEETVKLLENINMKLGKTASN